MKSAKKLIANCPEHLYQAVLLRINMEKVRRTKRRVAAFSTICILAFVSLIMSVWDAVSAFSASDFASYAKLVISDGTLVFTYWRELISALLEAIPPGALMLVFITLFVLVLTLKKLSEYIIQLPQTA